MPILVSTPYVAASRFLTKAASNAFGTLLQPSVWLTGFLVVSFWLVSGAPAVRGQSPLDGFDPNANGTAVRVVVVQPDGKILVGGDFNGVDSIGGTTGLTRNRIARLNPDGTLDTTFNPDANGVVHAIAVQFDGKIVVGGDFNGLDSIGGVTGQTRNRIARLNADGTLDTAFSGNANNTVKSIALQPDGQILAAGFFFGPNSIGGATRNRIARLNGTDGLADSFDPNVDGDVFGIKLQPDLKVLIGGLFANVGGLPHNNIARVNTNGTVDGAFTTSADFTVFAFAMQADGKILAGGQFSNIGGQSQPYIARLASVNGAVDLTFNANATAGIFTLVVQPDGKIVAGGANRLRRYNPSGVPDSFDPNPNNNIETIALQEDGRVVLGGVFTALAPNGGATVTRNRIARVETDGRLDQTLDLGLVGQHVLATAVQPDGKTLIGGRFSSVLGVPRNNIARLNTDGTLDASFDPNAGEIVLAIAVQADGKILLGGGFSNLSPNGGAAVTRNFIARVNPDGTLDTGFDPNANNNVEALALQPDGKILVGGIFTGLDSIGGVTGQTRNRIARLNADGTLDASFDPNPNGNVLSIAVQTDGKILIGGPFTTLSPNGGPAVSRVYIARLNTDGTPDAFDPKPNGPVLSIAVQPDGKILLGGGFTTLAPNGGPLVVRNKIARMNTDGTLDDPFKPEANGEVFSIAVQADGKILIGGIFTNLFPNGGPAVPRSRIARLNMDGTPDAFATGSIGNQVRSIALLADGKILIGGLFDNIIPHIRNRFARLSNDTAALQNLSVTQATITWTRGGSSPQFTRVTFEHSTDNVNYTPLGSGTPSGNTWTRTGLSLSTGMNFYIRARGYYRSGHHNGSESSTESVRNAFIEGPTAADATISGRILATGGAPVAGAVVNLTGTQTRKTITDAQGNYRFDNVETGGFYTVTPWRANYSFDPAERSFSQLGNTTEAVFTGTPNAALVIRVIDTAEYFVRQHYLDFLGREPDEAGFNFWSNQILECGPPNNIGTDCVERRRENVSAAYFLSIEFQQTGGLVDGLYRAGYGVRPNFAEFMPDTRAVGLGVVVGKDGWQAKLEANKQAFVTAFVNRPTFVGVYGNMDNSLFVDTLISHTGVSFTAGERDALVSSLANGTLSRSDALRSIAENQRFVTAKFNEAFVMMEYFGYLRREPDDSGYAFWLNKLNQFNGNFEQAEMVKAFILSGEYRNRFHH